MILLDTDHMTVMIRSAGPRYAALQARMEATGAASYYTTVVTLEEHLRGWLAEINRWSDVHKQVSPYQSLASLFRFFGRWQLIDFDTRAADVFKRLRKERVRIGTQDLKIASIALVQGALLLSANLRDYRRVPGLRVENWLEESAK
jgi:tRNA(fMet)-specific endonuclease VapC